jgi:hypothetical protein
MNKKSENPKWMNFLYKMNKYSIFKNEVNILNYFLFITIDPVYSERVGAAKSVHLSVYSL